MTTREMAILIWGIVIIGFSSMLSRGKIIKNVVEVLESLWKLVKLPISQWAIITNLLIVLELFYLARKENFELTYWYIKDYVIVFSFVIFPTILLLKEQKLTEIIKGRFREVIGFTGIVLFLGETYTFSIIVELVLVFVLFLVGAISAIAGTKTEYSVVEKLAQKVAIILGLLMLSGAIREFFTNISEIQTIDFWLSYAFELLVLILNIPILYISQKLIYIEKLIAFSDNPNSLLSFIRYYMLREIRKRNFKKFLIVKTDKNIEIQSEKFYFGYPKITIIFLNKLKLTHQEILDMIAQVLNEPYKFLKSKRAIDKFPIHIEIQNREKVTIALWCEDFISPKWQTYNPFRGSDEIIEICGNIKVSKELTV